MPSQAAIRIAISGGGLAGASLIHALLPYPHLDVHIFESAAAFKEAGAAIGIVQNARRALKLIGPSAIKCLEDAGAIPLQGVRRVMARGPDSGKEIDRIDATDQPITNIVHRAEFLRELLAGVPADRMHASKKLVKIEEPVDGSVTLTFADDTTHECDILIGADGIHSFVRKYLLGEDDPAASPVPAGWWFVQSLRPYEKGLAALGKEFVDLEYPVEFDYAGDGAFWMHNVLSKGSLVQSVISVKCDDAEAKENWKKTMSADTIREIFRNWPAPIPKAVDELICDEPTSTAFYLWEHLPANTYSKASVCITGDAAHATTPWMSSGVGMSIEDTLILSAVLGHSKTPEEARIALQVYDQSRRLRTQRVVESSHGTGLIVTGTKADFDLDSLAEMKRNLSPRWDFIRYFDLTEHRDEALELLRTKITRE